MKFNLLNCLVILMLLVGVTGCVKPEKKVEDVKKWTDAELKIELEKINKENPLKDGSPDINLGVYLKNNLPLVASYRCGYGCQVSGRGGAYNIFFKNIENENDCKKIQGFPIISVGSWGDTFEGCSPYSMN